MDAEVILKPSPELELEKETNIFRAESARMEPKISQLELETQIQIEPVSCKNQHNFVGNASG
jgi:hypothetical protein